MSSRPERAILLAGGLGTRLRPYTVSIPKPLVPVGDLPILEIIIRQLVKHGFEHITLAVNHQAELIRAFFGDGSKWDTRIDYSLEDKALSTMGPLRLINDLPENFLMMNGDVLTDLNFRQFADSHVEGQQFFSISSYIRHDLIDYGVLDVDEKNKLSGFREKPRVSHQVSMGVYMINRSVIDHIPVNEIFGFDDLMLKLLQEKRPVNVVVHDGEWLDIGRPDDYAVAVDSFESMRDVYLG